MIDKFDHATGALLFVGVLAVAGMSSATVLAQSNPAPSAQMEQDPGVRIGGTNVGGPAAGLAASEIGLFNAAKLRFQEIDSVSGSIKGEPGFGLGPRFNSNSCASCHAYPTIGGASPPVNPQVAVATLHGATNVLPSFITPNGPVRVARFVRNADGTPDGGVHDLFVISGRGDAQGCKIAQPNFASAVATNNVSLRIPTPVFGLGLVEATTDLALINSFNATASARSTLGIGGHFNTNGNDGTITRFGWKAQNKSLLVFAGEAYNVEQGVTNELFPNERETDVNCQFNGAPEDETNLTNQFNSGSAASDLSSDIVNFAAYMRLSAAPAPAQPTTARMTAGSQVFQAIGCQYCHTTTLTTGKSGYTKQSNLSYAPYSDFAVHNMGQGLADGVTQGTANGSEWRTAPLWGLGQRLFFMHDGRTSDLVTAINLHASAGSEANAVTSRWRALTGADKQSLLVFLRSL